MLRITEEPPDFLDEYATIPIAFTVDAPVPYVKDYDAHAGEGPVAWRQLDLDGWAFFAAHLNRSLVGGAAVARRAPEFTLLAGRSNAALLVDIRVAPEHRGTGVGSALFRAAERWSAAHGAHLLIVETQDVNVAAAKFYEAMGCTLAASNPNAYPDLPNEVQLLWHKRLVAGS